MYEAASYLCPCVNKDQGLQTLVPPVARQVKYIGERVAALDPTVARRTDTV